MNTLNNEPLFIPTSPELELFKTEKLPILAKKFNKSQLNVGLTVFKHVLYRKYGRCDITTFTNDINSNYDEADKVSVILLDIYNDFKWVKNTRKTSLYIFKQFLKSIFVSESFINKINIDPDIKMGKYNPKLILNKKYYSLPNDDKTKQRIMSWVNIIRNNSKNRSPQTIKLIIAFYLNSCVPKLSLDITLWDLNNIKITQDIIQSICKTIRQFNWLSLFCTKILEIDFDFNNNFITQNNDEKKWTQYYSGDKHVIPSNELDLIYNQTKKSDTFDQLMFLLFITTGMRVGGFVRIKLDHVCLLSKNDLKIFPVGRTLEKGNKWFEFNINPPVAKLLKTWILVHRKSNSVYLFPSNRTQTSYISTNTVRGRFKKLCKQGDLFGPHLHLHALRHSYAHILLKCGNKISIISKLLNHSNTQTTEQFYLKESISEVVDRANIPWLDNAHKPKNILPTFLNLQGKEDLDKTKRKERRKRRMETINTFLKTT